MLVLMVTLTLGLAGCSDSDDGDDAVSDKVTISGTAVDDPVADADVSVKDMQDAVLGSGKTDANGKYAIEVDKKAIEGGYQLVVSGGRMNGTAFTGELKALYGASENTDAANVTLITTLVTELIENMNAGMLPQRNAVIQRLSAIGMFKADQWDDLDPELVDLEALRSFVNGMGLKEWLDALAEDSKDQDLSAGLMTGFPNAHGGILSIKTGDDENIFTGMPGMMFEHSVQVNTRYAGQGGSADYTYEITGGPLGMAIDGQGNITWQIDADAAADSLFEYTVNVTNAATGFGRSFEGKVAIPGMNMLDKDGDGVMEILGDCNDADASIYPGAEDVCGDGIDQDCSGYDATCYVPPTPNPQPTTYTFYKDADWDGYRFYS